MTTEATPPDEKTPGHGAPDLGNEPGPAGTAVTETIDEIPMGGVPEPGDQVDETHHGEGTDHATTTGLSNNKMAMWLFLGSECLLFGALITTYVLYRNASTVGPYPAEVFDIGYTSVSSFVLLAIAPAVLGALSTLRAHAP